VGHCRRGDCRGPDDQENGAPTAFRQKGRGCRNVHRPDPSFSWFWYARSRRALFCGQEALPAAALMLRIDLFAFGEVFASLPLMFHEVVNSMAWLDGQNVYGRNRLGQYPGADHNKPQPLWATWFEGFPAPWWPPRRSSPVLRCPGRRYPVFRPLEEREIFSGATRGFWRPSSVSFST